MNELHCWDCDAEISPEQADATRNEMGQVFCEDCYEDTFDAAWESVVESGPTEAEW